MTSLIYSMFRFAFTGHTVLSLSSIEKLKQLEMDAELELLLAKGRGRTAPPDENVCGPESMFRTSYKWGPGSPIKPRNYMECTHCGGDRKRGQSCCLLYTSDAADE